MKIKLLMPGFAAAILFPALAQAQFSGSISLVQDLRIRDRNVRFSDSRLDALQMSAAIEDDSNALDLNSWGDNRAWLAKESSKTLKAEGSYFNGQEKSTGGTGNHNIASYTEFQSGVHTQLKSFELEAADTAERDKFAPSYMNETWLSKSPSGGAGYGCTVGRIMLGLHASLNSYKETDTDNSSGAATYKYADRQHAAGGAIAYKTDIGPAGVAFGGTADYVDRGYSSSMGSSSYERPSAGMQYGAQLVASFGNLLKLGLRGSAAKLRGDWTSPSSAYGYKTGPKEFGARVVLALGALTIGAETANKTEESRDDSAGSSYINILRTNRALAGGAALRLFGGRVLIGAEAGNSKWEYTDHNSGSPSNTTQDSFAGGVEVLPSARLAIRASARHLNSRYGFSSYKYTDDVFALGGGLHLTDNTALDLTVRRIISKSLSSTAPSEMNGLSGKVEMIMKF